MGYSFLIIGIIIIMIFCYCLFNKDILSPTIISCFMFLLSTIFALFGVRSWNFVNDIHTQTVFIILLGLFSFGLCEFMFRFFSKRNIQNNKRKFDLNYVYIQNWKYILSILIIIVEIVLLYKEIVRVCGIYGYHSNSISDLLSFYRYKTALYSVNTIEISNFVSQLKKVCEIMGVIYIYIFINNLICNEKIRKNLKFLIPIILCLLLSFLSSGRAQFMKYGVSVFIICLLLYSTKENNIQITKKFFKSGILILIILLPIFYFVLPLLGRTTDSSFIEYITFYLGSPIPSFDVFLSKTTVIGQNGFGSETLYGIQMLLYKLNLFTSISPISREWISFGSLASNVYTPFRRYYSDFGYIGVCICQLISSVIFSKIYYNSRYKMSKINIIIYGYFSYMLIDQVRDDLLFSSFISLWTMVYFVIIILLVWFLFDFDIVLGGKK